MEAKDTVMSVADLEYCFGKTKEEAQELRKVAEFQAERTDDMLKKQRRQEGREEVAAWVKNEKANQNPSVWYSRWQAKLKELGL